MVICLIDVLEFSIVTSCMFNYALDLMVDLIVILLAFGPDKYEGLARNLNAHIHI